VRTALDESFRLPVEVAAFLHRHVYAQDGIAFHSQNRQRLPAAELADGLKLEKIRYSSVKPFFYPSA